MSFSPQTQVDRFEQLTQLIKEDRKLQEELKAAPDQETWILRVVQFSKEKGIYVTAHELNERIKAKAAQRIDAMRALDIIHALSHSVTTVYTSPF